MNNVYCIDINAIISKKISFIIQYYIMVQYRNNNNNNNRVISVTRTRGNDNNVRGHRRRHVNNNNNNNLDDFMQDDDDVNINIERRQQNNNNMNAFNEVVDNSLAGGSKEGYKSKFNQFVTYVKNNFNEHYDVENNSIDFENISDECISCFFEDATKKKNKETGEVLIPNQFQSFTHVSGYNSAIKWYFKKERISMTPTIVLSILP